MSTANQMGSLSFVRAVFRNSFHVIVGGYGLSTSLFIILRLILDESFLPIALYNTVAQWLWIGAIPLFFVALILRYWRVAALLILPVLAFVFTFGFLYTDREKRPAGNDDMFSVMSYNIRWRDSDYQDTVNTIRQSNADIIGIQELGINAADIIENALIDEYPYQALHPEQHGTIGQGIISRYPITEDDYWYSDFVPYSFGQQRVNVDVNGTPIIVYNVHLNHPFIGNDFFNADSRRLQVADLIERVTAERARVVVIGDMNMVELNDDYATLTHYLADAHRRVGKGLGWTYSYNLFGGKLGIHARLDYILYNSFGLDAVASIKLPHAGGSDHYPTWAYFEIYDPTAS